MASKTSTQSRTARENDPTQAAAQTQEQMADITEKAASFFKEMEAVQQVHQHSAQRTALKLQQAAEQLRGSSNMTELLSIQSSLMLGGMQELALYMQEIGVTMLRMQVALVPKRSPMGLASGLTAAGNEAAPGHTLSAASTAADAATAATAAVLQSWSSLMGGGQTLGETRPTH